MARKPWSDDVVWDKETWQAIGLIAFVAIVAGAASGCVTHWLLT